MYQLFDFVCLLAQLVNIGGAASAEDALHNGDEGGHQRILPAGAAVLAAIVPGQHLMGGDRAVCQLAKVWGTLSARRACPGSSGCRTGFPPTDHRSGRHSA